MKTSPTMPCHWHLSTRSWRVCSSSRCCWIRNLREVGKGLQMHKKKIIIQHSLFYECRTLKTSETQKLHDGWQGLFQVLSWPFADWEHVWKINTNYISYLHGVAGVERFYLINSYFLLSSLCENPQIRSAATSGMYSSLWISCSCKRDTGTIL